MKIPEIERGYGTRIVSNSRKKNIPNKRFPQFSDKTCHYLDALWSTLLHYRPKFCIEIGTHDGANSTQVFTDYLREYQPDGHLITLDVVPCKNKLSDQIHQVIVFPHHARIEQTCGANGRWFTEKNLLPGFNEKFETSTIQNIEKIKIEMKRLGIDKFDLAFIDGDHERESLLKDMEICEHLLKDPKIMIIDDTKEEIHPCCHVYFDEIKKMEKYESYDFEDWSRFVGMSIVTTKS